MVNEANSYLELCSPSRFPRLEIAEWVLDFATVLFAEEDGCAAEEGVGGIYERCCIC